MKKIAFIKKLPKKRKKKVKEYVEIEAEDYYKEKKHKKIPDINIEDIKQKILLEWRNNH